MKKMLRSGEYSDVLLKKCKEHGGPLSSLIKLTNLVKNTKDKSTLKTFLRQVGFQKMLHPLDAKERSFLYKMNFLSVEQLAENISILLDDCVATNEGEEVVMLYGQTIQK